MYLVEDWPTRTVPPYITIDPTVRVNTLCVQYTRSANVNKQNVNIYHNLISVFINWIMLVEITCRICGFSNCERYVEQLRCEVELISKFRAQRRSGNMWFLAHIHETSFLEPTVYCIVYIMNYFLVRVNCHSIILYCY